MGATTLVLIGPHAAGKTTLGRLLAEALDWPFDDEIGKHLRLEALARDPGAHAFVPQPEFDERLIRAEWERDRRREGVSRIVETWHPGNLAYAEPRSPAVASRWCWDLRLACLRPGVLVQPVWIDLETLARRRNEPGPEGIDAGLLAVANGALAVAREWGLSVLPVVRTDRCTPAEAACLVLRGVYAWPSSASVPSTSISADAVTFPGAGTSIAENATP